MKIVATSDTHGYHRALVMPKDGDIFIHAGDIDPSFGSIEHLIDFNNWLGELPYKHKIVIAGNHDTCFEARPDTSIAQLTNCRFLYNEAIEIDGLKIYGSPHTIPFAGAFNTPPKQIYEIWKRIPDDTNIVVTHGPPKMILDACHTYREDEIDHAGDGYLYARIREIKPDLHLFGHIHESYGTYLSDFGTLFANVAALNFRYNCLNPPMVFQINPKKSTRQ